MAQGRCAGCGKTNQSCKVMQSHILSCPDYIALYKTDPTKALTPGAEFERWQAEDNNAEVRAVAKDERLAKKFAELDAKREVQAERWARPKDILDD